MDHVLVSPETVTLDIGQTVEFSAEAFDAYGNQITEADIRWEVVEAVGSLRNDGTSPRPMKWAGSIRASRQVDTTVKSSGFQPSSEN